MSKSTQSYKVIGIWTHSFNYQNYLEFENDDELENIEVLPYLLINMLLLIQIMKLANASSYRKNYYKSMNSF